MSALSEALERQLRKILPPPPVVVSKKERILVVGDPKVAPAKTSKNVIKQVQAKSICLAYQEGTSDKVYNIQLAKAPFASGTFRVSFQYGRRGKTLIEGVKTPIPVSWYEALNVYNDLVHDKKAKGYKEI
jgi:hypothetical protein